MTEPGRVSHGSWRVIEASPTTWIARGAVVEITLDTTDLTLSERGSARGTWLAAEVSVEDRGAGKCRLRLGTDVELRLTVAGPGSAEDLRADVLRRVPITRAMVEQRRRELAERERVAAEEARSAAQHAAVEARRQALQDGFPEVHRVLQIDPEAEAFECVECGRWAEATVAFERYWTSVEDDVGLTFADWAELVAGDAPIRPAVLQRDFGRTYEEALQVLERSVQLGLLEASAKGAMRGRARCAVCYERRARPPEPGLSGPRSRDAVPPQLRFRVLQRDGFRCSYCGASASDGAKLHLDHVVPVTAGGETSEDNLLTACETCNLGKSASRVV